MSILRSFVAVFLVALFFSIRASAQIRVTIDPHKAYQTIAHFGASDAWSAQVVGLWPEAQKNRIADLLFSMDTLKNGSPAGAGLSLWRFNVGAGSAQQGRQSGIKDSWRRAPSVVDANGSYTWEDVKGQLWFLKAAKQRGVAQYLAFLNSPPVHLTKNARSYATSGQTNIDTAQYEAFARYLAAVIKGVHKKTGVQFNYISPVNEPQWDWSDGGQEGCPYSNTEVAQLTRKLVQQFKKDRLSTRIVLPEAADIKYLFSGTDKPGRDDQINFFFNQDKNFSNESGLAKTMAAHSYFSTSPQQESVDRRKAIAQAINQIPGLNYWQSEYCILGDNNGDIKGEGRDLSMATALYLARVMHDDLVYANASAWHWWLAISPYNYKDGLIYVDKREQGGSVYPSKALWAFGNYSRFIRPGMVRIAASYDSNAGMQISAYTGKADKQLVVVVINAGKTSKQLAFQYSRNYHTADHIETFTTDKEKDLEKCTIKENRISVAPESVTTIIIKRG